MSTCPRSLVSKSKWGGGTQVRNTMKTHHRSWDASLFCYYLDSRREKAACPGAALHISNYGVGQPHAAVALVKEGVASGTRQPGAVKCCFCTAGRELLVQGMPQAPSAWMFCHISKDKRAPKWCELTAVILEQGRGIFPLRWCILPSREHGVAGCWCQESTNGS